MSRRHNTKILCMSLIFLGLAALSAEAKTASTTVAVFDFQSVDTQDPQVGAKVADLLRAEMSVDIDLVLVERESIDKTLNELEIGLSGMVSENTAAKVGKILGARILVLGRVFSVDQELVIIAKIIGTETSRVFAEVARGPLRGQLSAMTQELAGKIRKRISGNLNAFVGQEREVDLTETLVRLVKGRPLPVVSVNIPEQHVGRPIQDPAAETELLFLLKRCGFTVAGEPGGLHAKTQVKIEGEAFSEFATRRSNLISCKARVELRAIDNETGALLAIDRQTGVAVDLAENVAAKTAIEEATRDLALRFIPRLLNVLQAEGSRN